MMVSHQSNGVVIRRNKHPPSKIMFVGKMQEIGDICLIVSSRPRNSTLDISRRSCDGVSSLIDEPDWYPTASKASHYAQSAIIGPHHKCAGCCRVKSCGERWLTDWGGDCCGC